MYQSMVAIQSPTAEIRRGKKRKKKKKKNKPQHENIYGLPITQGDHKTAHDLPVMMTAMTACVQSMFYAYADMTPERTMRIVQFLLMLYVRR